MPTIADELWNLTIAFRALRIESARLDAELLLMHALGLDRTGLLVRLQDEMPAEAAARVAAMANRRLDGEPIAYVTGQREFFGLELEVDRNVLVPRPETELLVEWALGLLKGRERASVIDVGTGSGAIAVAVAASTPQGIEITATDISPDALEIARRNAERHAPGRIAFVESDLLAGVSGQFDIVLANLPYLTPEQIAESASIAAEPVLALDGGEDGTDLIVRLLSELPDHLAEAGAVGLELDPSHAATVAERTAAALPGHKVTILRDLAGLDRFVVATRLVE